MKSNSNRSKASTSTSCPKKGSKNITSTFTLPETNRSKSSWEDEFPAFHWWDMFGGYPNDTPHHVKIRLLGFIEIQQIFSRMHRWKILRLLSWRMTEGRNPFCQTHQLIRWVFRLSFLPIKLSPQENQTAGIHKVIKVWFGWCSFSVRGDFQVPAESFQGGVSPHFLIVVVVVVVVQPNRRGAKISTKHN